MLRALPLGVVLAALVALTAAPAQAARPLGLPAGEAVLFTLQADSGAFVPVKGKKDRFVLTLRDVARQGLWFTDRPARQTGSLRIAKFFADWNKLGFRSDPPNAVVSITGGNEKADAVAVELGRPRYDARTRTVRFGARALNSLSAGLSHLGPKLDPKLPARFGETALFVDDVLTGSQATCGYLAQVDLFPSSVRLGAYYAANGQLVPVRYNQALDSLMFNTFGGDGLNTVGIPNLTAPDLLTYQLCSYGLFPIRAESDYDTGAQCSVGEIALGAQTFQAAGWVPADGRLLQVAQAKALYNVTGRAFGGSGDGKTFYVPNIPGPKSANGKQLTYYVCANGIPWSAKGATAEPCTQSQISLFATTRLPANYVPADGRLLSISQYQVLYVLLGSSFGGDGIETFATPNLRPPVIGAAYGVCSSGLFPQSS